MFRQKEGGRKLLYSSNIRLELTNKCDKFNFIYILPKHRSEHVFHMSEQELPRLLVLFWSVKVKADRQILVLKVGTIFYSYITSDLLYF